MSAIILSGLAMGLAAAPAQAAEQDTQFWLTASAKLPLAPDIALTLEVSPRIRSSAAGDDQLLLRSTLDANLEDWLSLGGGIAYVESSGADEIRLFEQLTLKSGPFALRSQFEQRFFEGGARPQLRLRERIQLTLPIDPNDRLQVSGELFYILRPISPVDQSRVEQGRFKLEWRHRLNPRLEIGAAYMLVLAPRENAPDRLSHVPQLALAYSF